MPKGPGPGWATSVTRPRGSARSGLLGFALGHDHDLPPLGDACHGPAPGVIPPGMCQPCHLQAAPQRLMASAATAVGILLRQLLFAVGVPHGVQPINCSGRRIRVILPPARGITCCPVAPLRRRRTGTGDPLQASSLMPLHPPIARAEATRRPGSFCGCRGAAQDGGCAALRCEGWPEGSRLAVVMLLPYRVPGALCGCALRTAVRRLPPQHPDGVAHLGCAGCRVIQRVLQGAAG
mmetsp:Transcript_27203/g.76725  ORF Transcript_27203/g.76725 Transcript_27203/m.76725 type:complete len:236 (-) Transcript_27203:133-840(-)